MRNTLLSPCRVGQPPPGVFARRLVKRAVYGKEHKGSCHPYPKPKRLHRPDAVQVRSPLGAVRKAMD